MVPGWARHNIVGLEEAVNVGRKLQMSGGEHTRVVLGGFRLLKNPALYSYSSQVGTY